MGANVAILDNEGHLLESSHVLPAGSIIKMNLVEGELQPCDVAESEATWTYNYHHIWTEAGWNPWRWFDEVGESVEITPDVIKMLNEKLELVKALPHQDRSRNEQEGYWAATPANAVKMIAWMIHWANFPGASKIVRGSR